MNEVRCERCGEYFIPKQTQSQKYCSGRKRCGRKMRATRKYSAKFHDLARVHVLVQRVKRTAATIEKDFEKL